MSNKAPVENPYQTLLLISEEINSTHDISQLLDRIMELAMEAVNAERGFILLQKTGSTDYETVTAHNFSGNVFNRYVIIPQASFKRSCNRKSH